MKKILIAFLIITDLLFAELTPAEVFNNAQIHLNKDEFKEAIKLYETLPNNKYAVENIARIYNHQKNYIKSLELYIKALNMGNLNANIGLGDAYFFGWGIKPNTEKAIDYYLNGINAKTNEDGYAEFILYYIYNLGVDIPKDENKSFEYLKMSYKKGYYKSYGRMGLNYLNGINVKKDINKAISLFKKGVALNNGDSLYYLALLYCLGEGIETDINKSYELVTKATQINGFHNDNATKMLNVLCKTYYDERYCK